MNQQANLESCGVSNHAISQFQTRIARLDYMSARRVIRDGIQNAENILALPDGNTLRVRTRRPFPFEFRAFCVFDKERGHFVVTTIVRGDSCVTRKRKLRVPSGVNPAESAANEFSPVFQRRDQAPSKIRVASRRLRGAFNRRDATLPERGVP